MTSPDFIQRNVTLDRLNTFALPARAARFATITAPAQPAMLVCASNRRDIPRLILGGGSNLILTSDFDGLVLHVQIPGRAFVVEVLP